MAKHECAFDIRGRAVIADVCDSSLFHGDEAVVELEDGSLDIAGPREIAMAEVFKAMPGLWEQTIGASHQYEPIRRVVGRVLPL